MMHTVFTGDQKSAEENYFLLNQLLYLTADTLPEGGEELRKEYEEKIEDLANLEAIYWMAWGINSFFPLKVKARQDVNEFELNIDS